MTPTTLESNNEPSHGRGDSAKNQAVTILVPAHGKWLNVEKKKKKPLQKESSGGTKFKEATKGNKFHALSTLPEIEPWRGHPSQPSSQPSSQPPHVIQLGKSIQY